MNLENINIAITVMERVIANHYNFDMSTWQNKGCLTEAEGAECGTAACFGGWLSLSPEWQAKGGSICLDDGKFSPMFQDESDFKAIALFLDVPDQVARDLTTYAGENCFEDEDEEGGPVKVLSCLYGVPYYESRRVTPYQVLEQLQNLRDHGKLKYLVEPLPQSEETCDEP